MNIETLEQVGMGIVKFQLETEPDDFYRRRSRFVEDLAIALHIQPEQIWITHIRPGCTIVVILLPLEVRKKLLSESRSDEKSPQILQLEQDYTISRTDFDDLIIGPYPESKLPIQQTGRRLTWLHLSDVHLRSKKGTKQWLQDQVTEELLNDLPDLLADRGLRPDLVFFTGDLAYSAQEDEYNVAKGFLTRLVEKLPMKPSFFFVPGNHDVNWDKIDNRQDRKIREKLVDDEAVVQHLIEEIDLDNGDWDNRLQRFENFFNFVKDVSGLNQPPINHKYFYTAEIKHLGLHLGIAGLNSAWLSTSKKGNKKSQPDPDLGNLLLGRPQVMTALEQLDKSHIRFALFHHPLASEWFKPFDAQMQKNKLPEFDFILSGHEHKAEALGMDIGFERTLYHLAAGALYDHPEYPNSFNVSTIDLDKGWFTIFFWSYHQKKSRWDIDTSVEFTRSGRIEFFLRPALRKRISDAIRPPGTEFDQRAMIARGRKES
jgi:predicted MPP superfamily phosphohydrolase